MKRDYDIIWLDSVDSTNDEVRRHIDELDNLSVVSVLSQSCGRGQRGNSWISEPGKNLLFSVLLKYSDVFGDTSMSPQVLAYDQFVISQLTSLAVVDLLASHDIEARIKWPNDIYAGGRKICGMLIENTVRGKSLGTSIIGIGLNINQRNFDVNLPNPTSMVLAKEGFSEVETEDFDTHVLLEEFMDILTEYIDRFCHITGGYNRLSKLYLSQLWRLNEPTEFLDTARNIRFRGIIRGTSPVGHLLVELPDGTTREFTFKEIAYVL
jgi:BirA family biotin operon repressor/biotin-[acetyl-CoA-carboxylase] ligase